jgi:pimeloyl-ACP methyl ester carboxylesterase
MPFRIKVFLSVLLAFAGAALIAPLLIPVRELSGTTSEAALADSASLFADLPGLRVHYHESGAGSAEPALVLLHGFGFNVHSWREITPELADGHHVVAFDRPAFGLTSRPQAGDWAADANPYTPEAQARLTTDLLDELGIGQAVLIGHSSGGAVALEVALRNPERVAGLILVAPAVYNVGGPPPALRPLLGTPHLKRMGPLLMRQLSGEAGLNFVRSNWADQERMTEEAYAAYVLNFSAHDWDKALWELSRASHEVPFLDRLGSIGVPALVISGSADPVVPPAESEKLAQELPSASFALLPDCGHVPHEECAPQLTELVRQWLGEQGLAGGERGLAGE